MTLVKDAELKKIDMEATGKLLKNVMEEKQISIRELSIILNVSFQAVYRWQRGETLPSIRNLFTLGQILEMNADDLLVAKEK